MNKTTWNIVAFVMQGIAYYILVTAAGWDIALAVWLAIFAYGIQTKFGS